MGCASEFTTIDERKLIVKGSQKFKPKLFKYFGSEKPYTGEAINHLESGKKESAGPFHNGRKNGIWTYWHEPVIRKINVETIESKGLEKIWDEGRILDLLVSEWRKERGSKFQISGKGWEVDLF